jgi:hypothetical protein
MKLGTNNFLLLHLTPLLFHSRQNAWRAGRTNRFVVTPAPNVSGSCVAHSGAVTMQSFGPLEFSLENRVRDFEDFLLRLLKLFLNPLG